MATPTVFLEIGGTDVTAYLDIQNYQMNREDVYDTWTDGNGRDHRVITRTRARGKTKAGFRSAAAFAAFCALLANAKQTGGWYNVRAYISNTGATESFQAFIDAQEDSDKWDRLNGRQWQVQTLTITEV